MQSRTQALAKLISLCEPTTEPRLEISELEAILDRRFGLSWEPERTLAVGAIVYPSASNGRRYIVTKSGITGATEPESWALSSGAIVTDGTVTFENDGIESGVGYDVNQAAWEAWNKKCAKASHFIKTPGIDMSIIYDRCKEMRDSFETALVA